jgi:hypothetical protein
VADLVVDYRLLEGVAARLDGLTGRLSESTPVPDTGAGVFGRGGCGGAVDGFFGRWDDGCHQVADNLAGLAQGARTIADGFHQVDSRLGGAVPAGAGS